MLRRGAEFCLQETICKENVSWGSNFETVNNKKRGEICMLLICVCRYLQEKDQKIGGKKMGI